MLLGLKHSSSKALLYAECASYARTSVLGYWSAGGTRLVNLHVPHLTLPQEHESEAALSLELALASERGKLMEENKKALQRGQRSLLETAHREWTKAQEAVTSATVDRARREWEREERKRIEVRCFWHWLVGTGISVTCTCTNKGACMYPCMYPLFAHA